MKILGLTLSEITEDLRCDLGIRLGSVLHNQVDLDHLMTLSDYGGNYSMERFGHHLKSPFNLFSEESIKPGGTLIGHALTQHYSPGLGAICVDGEIMQVGHIDKFTPQRFINALQAGKHARLNFLKGYRGKASFVAFMNDQSVFTWRGTWQEESNPLYLLSTRFGIFISEDTGLISSIKREEELLDMPIIVKEVPENTLIQFRNSQILDINKVERN